MGFCQNLKGGLSYNIDPLKNLLKNSSCGKVVLSIENIEISMLKTLCKSCGNVDNLGGICAKLLGVANVN